MNKELIKNYKTEFDHFINGGSILARTITLDEDGFMYTIWYEVDGMELECWKADYLFNLTDTQVNYYKPQVIINDEYVEFRKAGAEGKQLQVSYPNSPQPTMWYDTSYHKISWSNTQSIRIKPEPTIKVGNWLFDNRSNTYDKIVKISNDCVKLQSGLSVFITAIHDGYFKIWKPKIGEWCIIDSTNSGYESYSFTVQKWGINSKWTPAPYTGPIPYFIKDL